MDPQKQFNGFGDLLWFLGMVDESERAVFHKYESAIQVHLAVKDYRAAFHAFDDMLNGDRITYPTYYANVTGMKTNYFNFEQSPDGSSLTQNYFINWLKTPEARKLVHVGNIPYAVLNATVEYHLLDDWMQGVTEFLIPLLENPDLKVMIYSGQNDIILGAPLTEQFLFGLDWQGKSQYQAAKKAVWKIPGSDGAAADVAGYARTVEEYKVTQVNVRGAGHMVPGDQPERAMDMLDRFISGKPF
jgi:vitellogenic carboxypeptidase-like protein